MIILRIEGKSAEPAELYRRLDEFGRLPVDVAMKPPDRSPLVLRPRLDGLPSMGPKLSLRFDPEEQGRRVHLSILQSDSPPACGLGWPPERRLRSPLRFGLEAVHRRRTPPQAQLWLDLCRSYFARSALHSSALKIRTDRPTARLATRRGRGRTELLTISQESANWL